MWMYVYATINMDYAVCSPIKMKKKKTFKTKKKRLPKKIE